MSVLAAVLPAEGCEEAAALGLPSPKEPEPESDSAARESAVTVPTPSWMGIWDRGSVVTWAGELIVHDACGVLRRCKR